EPGPDPADGRYGRGDPGGISGEMQPSVAGGSGDCNFESGGYPGTAGKGHGGSEAAERKRGGSVSVFRENILEGERTMEYELILLAAGFSRRFGENKLLYPVEGVPMYLRAAKLLLRLKRQRQDIRGIRAVTRYPEIRRELRRRGIPTVMNEHSERGISSSLREGLRAALAGEEPRKIPGKRAFCFFMGDQPYLREDTVSGFLDRYPFCGKGMARLCFRGQPGNPAVFGEGYVPELLALTGDQGGRRV